MGSTKIRKLTDKDFLPKEATKEKEYRIYFKYSDEEITKTFNDIRNELGIPDLKLKIIDTVPESHSKNCIAYYEKETVFIVRCNTSYCLKRIIYHEVAHHFQQDKLRVILAGDNKFEECTKKFIKRNVGVYASTYRTEFISEVFSMYKCGRHLSDSILLIYKNIIDIADVDGLRLAS